jgi:preprotein translocase subunit SecA
MESIESTEPTEKEFEELRKAAFKARKNWMRNKPCPCGSGKKYKNCCWANIGKLAKLLKDE